MELLKWYLLVLVILLATLALVYALTAYAQEGEVCTVQNGVTVCEENGVWCIVNEDGSKTCRTYPPIVSPVTTNEYWLYLPRVER